jgi:hypothetical protein
MPLFYRTLTHRPGACLAATSRRSAPVVVGLLASAVAVLGVAAVWAGVAAMTGTQCGWMAPLAALDAALLLRLADWRAGRGRALVALVVTAATVIVGNALVATTLIGRAMGMRPFEAVSRMTLDLAWLHTWSNSGATEAAWYLLALALAWLAGR